eukprot:TRINITY_DN2838_c2_g3_i1.p1 TRINITY_DN2838_c2_g3~~TRINITY_DN2838_c2_g3_i1.p1  ORF type:complete len:371 (+),score=98.91 TRINITY_DN2838_c2_g3_i1:108-1220(+)
MAATRARDREQQRAAVAVMERTAAELTAMVEDSKQMHEQAPALERFASQVEVANQVDTAGEVRRRSSIQTGMGERWNKALGDGKIETAAPESDGEYAPEGPVEEEGLLRLTNGVTDCESGTDSPAADPFDVAPFSPEAAAPAASDSSPAPAVPAGLINTPGKAQEARRASATNQHGGDPAPPLRRGSSLRQPQPPADPVARRPSGRASRVVFTGADGAYTTAPRASAAERYGSFRAGSLSSAGTGSFRSGGGGSFRTGRAASLGSAGRQRDSSATRINGRIDYSALLGEQQADLTARRSSMQEYKVLLKGVETYQQQMLEHLDRQMLSMNGGAAAASCAEDGPPPNPAMTKIPAPQAAAAPTDAGDFYQI